MRAARTPSEVSGDATDDQPRARRKSLAAHVVQVQFEAPTEGDAERWAEAVNRESNRANQAKQALMKVHPELSAITYLSSVKPDSLAPGGWAPTQMCSMDETQARKNLKHGGLHNTRNINGNNRNNNTNNNNNTINNNRHNIDGTNINDDANTKKNNQKNP